MALYPGLPFVTREGNLSGSNLPIPIEVEGNTLRLSRVPFDSTSLTSARTTLQSSKQSRILGGHNAYRHFSHRFPPQSG